jgi:hypothetical protein
MKNEMISRIVGWSTFFLTLFVCILVMYTFDSEKPYESTDSVTNVTKQDGAYVLIESRGFAGTDKQVLTIFRSLYKKDSPDHITSVEGGAIINQTSEYVILRTIILPPHLNGAWCSKAEVYWRPSLSLKQHSASLPDLCFEVPKNEKSF